MPLYDFKCRKCGLVTEQFARMDERTGLCSCGAETERQISRHYVIDDIDVVTEDLYPNKSVHITSRRQLRNLLREHGVVERYGKGWI